MEIITLYVCKNLLIKDNNFKLLFFICVLLLPPVIYIFDWEFKWPTIIISALFLILVVFYVILNNDKNKKLKNNQFYIAEDVFINVKRRRVYSRYNYHELCTFKFSKNGTYNMRFFEKHKTEPKKPSCDYSAVNFSKPGDKVYLLILCGEKEDKILKCFNAKYYKVSDLDFEYKDGEYYPKV